MKCSRTIDQHVSHHHHDAGNSKKYAKADLKYDIDSKYIEDPRPQRVPVPPPAIAGIMSGDTSTPDMVTASCRDTSLCFTYYLRLHPRLFFLLL